MSAHNSPLRSEPFEPTRRRLLQNACHIPEKGVYLRSSHVHDYVTLTLDDGVEVMRDGGCEYIRSSVDDPKRVIDWSIYTDDPFEVVAERYLWGTYGRYGKGPLVIKPLAKCTLAHLKAIAETQAHIKGTLILRVVEYWIKTKEAEKRRLKRKRARQSA